MITKHLQEIIQYLPKNKWFRHYELPARVSRNEWVCRRLTEEGILQSKTEWVYEKDLPLEQRTNFQTETIYMMPS